MRRVLIRSTTVLALLAVSVQPMHSAVETLADDGPGLEHFKPAAQVASEWVRRPELQRSLVGLEILDVQSGRVLFSHNGNKRFTTASTAKAITNACAFELLGSNFSYKTSIVGQGQIHNSRLTGSLTVVPSQDPSFSFVDLQNLVAQVQTKIKTVHGKVQVGGVAGGGDRWSTEWLAQDWGQDWMPASSDFIIDSNIVDRSDPGRGMPSSIVTSDMESNALLRTLLKSTWAPAWVQYRSGNSVSYYKPDASVSGAVVVANPTAFNGAILANQLKAQGIKVEGRETVASDPFIPLGEHQSKPLAEIIRFCLKESDNLYAQQLLRSVGALEPVNKSIEKATLEERGLVRQAAWLSTCGVQSGDVVMYDGCGLSRKNAITPHALNMVLRHMASSPTLMPFLDLMTHDSDGLSKSWHYKTGAMDSVRAITGIVRTATGQPMAVTAVINAHTPSVRELRTSLQALISRLETLGEIKLTPAKPKPVVKKVGPVRVQPPRGAVKGKRKPVRSRRR